MILTLAMRNLFYDKVSLAVTLIGILFSVVLVSVQLGIYAGTSRIITAVVEHAKGDIWIAAYGTKSIEQSGELSGNERYTALATPGVGKVFPIVSSFNEWKKPDGGSQLCVVVGTDVADDALVPWNVVAGGLDLLKLPNAVAIDDTYFKYLGVEGVGSTAEIGNQRVRVTTLTHGIRSFTTTPYIFTTLDRARKLQGMPPNSASFYLVQLEEGADLETVSARSAAAAPRSRHFDQG